MSLTISEVCDRWARRTHPSGRAGNVFFETDTIYSYGHHFPIARHVIGGGVLLTTRTYSVTTSSHVSATAHAIGYGRSDVFHVPNVDASSKDDHAENLADYAERVVELVERAKRARKYGASYRRDADELAAEAKRYADHFMLTWTDPREAERKARAIEEDPIIGTLKPSRYPETEEEAAEMAARAERAGCADA